MVQLLDLLFDCVERELHQKHFFLLVDELCNVLRAHLLLTRELDTTVGNVHGGGDVPTLISVETEVVRACSVIF